VTSHDSCSPYLDQCIESRDDRCRLPCISGKRVTTAGPLVSTNACLQSSQHNIPWHIETNLPIRLHIGLSFAGRCLEEAVHIMTSAYAQTQLSSLGRVALKWITIPTAWYADDRRPLPAQLAPRITSMLITVIPCRTDISWCSRPARHKLYGFSAMHATLTASTLIENISRTYPSRPYEKSDVKIHAENDCASGPCWRRRAWTRRLFDFQTSSYPSQVTFAQNAYWFHHRGYRT